MIWKKDADTVCASHPIKQVIDRDVALIRQLQEGNRLFDFEHDDGDKNESFEILDHSQGSDSIYEDEEKSKFYVKK